MGAYEFQLLEHNFQNNGFNTLKQMNQLSTDGWWVETSAIAFPYIYILWKRPVDGAEAAPAAADHSGCQSDLAQAISERDAALASAEQHEQDAQQMQRARDAAVSQVTQLQQQLADAQKVVEQPEAKQPGTPDS